MSDGYVYLILRVTTGKDDIVSIWTTEEMAKAALEFHRMTTMNSYSIKKWKINVTYNQWD